MSKSNSPQTPSLKLSSAAAATEKADPGFTCSEAIAVARKVSGTRQLVHKNSLWTELAVRRMHLRLVVPSAFHPLSRPRYRYGMGFINMYTAHSRAEERNQTRRRRNRQHHANVVGCLSSFFFRSLSICLSRRRPLSSSTPIVRACSAFWLVADQTALIPAKQNFDKRQPLIVWPSLSTPISSSFCPPPPPSLKDEYGRLSDTPNANANASASVISSALRTTCPHPYAPVPRRHRRAATALLGTPWPSRAGLLSPRS